MLGVGKMSDTVEMTLMSGRSCLVRLAASFVDGHARNGLGRNIENCSLSGEKGYVARLITGCKKTLRKARDRMDAVALENGLSNYAIRIKYGGLKQ